MIHSFKVVTTLAAQRIVSMYSGTADTVGYPESVQQLPIGITKDTVLDTTGAISVACAGEIAKLYFNDTVAASGLVCADTSGRGVPYGLLNNTTSSASTTAAFVGVLIGPAVAATGTIADVLIMPSYNRKSS